MPLRYGPSSETTRQTLPSGSMVTTASFCIPSSARTTVRSDVPADICGRPPPGRSPGGLPTRKTSGRPELSIDAITIPSSDGRSSYRPIAHLDPGGGVVAGRRRIGLRRARSPRVGWAAWRRLPYPLGGPVPGRSPEPFEAARALRCAVTSGARRRTALSGCSDEAHAARHRHADPNGATPGERESARDRRPTPPRRCRSRRYDTAGKDRGWRPPSSITCSSPTTTSIT